MMNKAADPTHARAMVDRLLQWCKTGIGLDSPSRGREGGQPETRRSRRKETPEGAPFARASIDPSISVSSDAGLEVLDGSPVADGMPTGEDPMEAGQACCADSGASRRDIGSRLGGEVEAVLDHKTSRRGFFKAAAGAGAGVAAASATGCGTVDWDRFFQKHYKEMTDDDKAKVFARIQKESKERFGKDVSISDPPPPEGAAFVFCINLSVCNGNRRCVEACVKENNQSRDPAIQYIKVVELDRGTFDLERGDLYYDDEKVPRPGKVYLPMQCNQCDNPPCVKACPVEATWKEKDGIVVIDYDWCIGCRYCMAACPYEARRFNFAEPKVSPNELNPNQGYLSNRVRPKGVVEKCHFCLHRTREGAYPACLEACPTGARKFGNLKDPESEVARIIREKRVFVLKEELKTSPRIFYYFD